MTIQQMVWTISSGSAGVYVLKPTDETEVRGSLADDSHLIGALEPGTVYAVRAAIYLTNNGAGYAVRLHASASVEFASLRLAHASGSLSGDVWPGVTADNARFRFRDTTQFNAGTSFSATGQGLYQMVGIIKTINACDLSYQWGGSGANVTSLAGGWLVAIPVEEL